MENQFTRTEMLLGKEAVDKLKNSRVAVFGLGGVGGSCVEALARSGVGAIDLIDNDRISITNINRQIFATNMTLGMLKTEAAAMRIGEINMFCRVKRHNTFFLDNSDKAFDFSQYDYVVDAIDTIAGKMSIILEAKRAGVPVISSMGAGNKLDPTAFTVSDIYKTSVCPLAKVIRGLCRKNDIDSLKVVYSKEMPKKTEAEDCVEDIPEGRRSLPGSVAFVPPAVGLIMAGEVVKDLIK